MPSRDQLTRAVRELDRLAEEHDFLGTLRQLDLEFGDVDHVAHQRALRLDLVTHGRELPRANEPVAVTLSDPICYENMALAWLDGFCAGLLVARDGR